MLTCALSDRRLRSPLSLIMIYTSVDTFYLSENQMKDSPSRKDGVDEETETILRSYGCELIQESGILLKMPEVVMATGQVLFHRFYCKKSFARFNVKRVAACCVWLAAKLEESPRKIRDVQNVFHRMECRREHLPLDPLDPISKIYEELKTDFIRTERHLLKEMGFICHVEHPHKFIISYLMRLNAPDELMQEAWNLANDSLRTTLCVRFKSEVVACGVVYAAARRFQLPLPENPPWWQVFDAEKVEVDEVCSVLAKLYKQSKAHYIEVGRDGKYCVLLSKFLVPPLDVQESLVKTPVNGSQLPLNPISDAEVRRDFTVKSSAYKLKASSNKNSRKDNEDLQASTTNNDSRDCGATGKSIQSTERDGRDLEWDKEKERELIKDREQERDRKRKRGRERVCDHDRDREREREREERERSKARMKDRSHDAGYLEKTRHHSSRGTLLVLRIGADRDSLNYISVREKERHRHRSYA